ncbi:hypothetical protein [uncultured Mediterranean phage]|nr:hypothetical protein [uncultured Mediterranean phage]
MSELYLEVLQKIEMIRTKYSQLEITKENGKLYGLKLIDLSKDLDMILFYINDLSYMKYDDKKSNKNKSL